MVQLRDISLQISEGVRRSVQIDRTAAHFSWALTVLGVRRSFFLGAVFLFFNIVFDFFAVSMVFSFYTHFYLAFFRPDHHALAVHTAYHVKRVPGLAAKRHLQNIVLNAVFNSLLELVLDLKVAVCRAQAADPLVRAFVVVVFDPHPHPRTGVFKARKLRPDKKILKYRAPETLDLAQCLRMMRLGFDVLHALLLKLGFKTGRSPPVGVLAAIVREHLLGRVVFGYGRAVDFNHMFGCLAPKKPHARDIPGVIINVTDQVGIFSAQTEGEDVGLPELIRRAPFKETGPGNVALTLLLGLLNQRFLFKRTPNGLRTGLYEEHALEYV
jgi:hypothetical protein